MKNTSQRPSIQGNDTTNQGQAAAPQVSSNQPKAEPSKVFAEKIQRQATHPVWTSAEYQNVIAKCVAAHAAQREPSSASLSWSFPEFDPRLAALLLALLILLGTILAGCKTVQALQSSPFSNHAAAIEREAE